MLNKKMGLLTALCAFALSVSCAFADEAVFAPSVQEVELKPAAVEAPVAAPVAKEAAPAVNTTPASPSLAGENFKNAANNLDAAQVDVREQLANCKALLDQKVAELNAKKAEVATVKSQYKALDKKMKSIDKMKKMLNEHISE